MGEDIGVYGGAYAVIKGLLDEFGPERVRDTPIPCSPVLERAAIPSKEDIIKAAKQLIS